MLRNISIITILLILSINLIIIGCTQEKGLIDPEALPGEGINKPDLIVSSASTNQNNLSLGTFFTINAIVRNKGDADADTCTIRFYFFNDTNKNEYDIKVAGVPQLAAGNSTDIDISDLFLPDDILTNNYHLGTEIDIKNNIDESKEDNNIYNGTTILNIQGIEALPNLHILNEEIVCSDTVLTQGQTFYASETIIINDGHIATDTTCIIKFFFSPDTILNEIDDYYVDEETIPTLDKEESYILTSTNHSLTVPDTIPTNDYYLIGVVDYENAINECDEWDNTKWSNNTISISGIAE